MFYYFLIFRKTGACELGLTLEFCPYRLAFSLFLHDSCFYLKRKEWAFLVLLFYQYISPLSEVNQLDLNLGVIWCFPALSFLSSFIQNISCFDRIWESRTWPLGMVLQLHLVHRFDFSTAICVQVNFEKLVNLGCIVLRRVFFSWMHCVT